MLIEGQKTLDEKLAEAVAGGLDPEQIADDIATARQEAIDAAFAEITAVEGTLSSMIGGKTATKWSTSNPPTVYDGAVDDTWVKLTSLGSGGREIGRFRWNGNVWVTHKVDGAVLSNVDAATITTGFLDVVNRIRAGSILADKLIVASGANVIPSNPDPKITDFPFLNYDEVEGGVKAPGKATHYSESPFVLPSGKYQMTIDMKSSVEGTTAYMGIYSPVPRWVYGISNQSLTSEWETYSGVFEVSEERQEHSHTLRYLPAYEGDPTATVWFRNLSVRPMVGGTLIEPGGIQTPHLAADVLEVGNLKVGTAALAEAVIAKLFAEVVVAKMVGAEEFIGENAILTGAVTASKITASEELWAKLAQFVTVRAEMVDADVFKGRRFEGVDIAASRFTAGEAVEITESYGIRQFGPDGALNVSFPSDGSPATFAGDVRAKSLTATGRMSIEGPAVVASGGQLQLESGVTPPATPPNVSSYTKRTQFPQLADNENAVGLAFDGTHFWRAVDNSVTGGPDRMERIDTSGNLVSSFEHEFWVRNGITVIGSELFALGIEEGPLRDKSKRFIYVYDFNGTLVRKWEYAAYGSGEYQPGIGTDGTYVYVAQCWADGHVSWRKYDKTTGVGQARYDSVAKIGVDIVGFDIGTFDYGTSTAVLTGSKETGGVDIFHPTTGERTYYGGWYAGDKEAVRGTVWANGRFHHLSTNGNLITMSTTKYPNGTNGPDTNDWWAVYTWHDGTNETTISTPRQFTCMRRAGIKLSTGEMPAGVSSVRVYVARKSTEPARTDYGLVSAVWSGDSLVLQDLGTPGANPPTSNTFPNSTPGLIRSTQGGFEVKGDGSGKWGPLTFNPDGTMSSSAVPAWVPVTTFASGYGPQTWGFAPAYRVWPDEKVEWRGVIRKSGTPTSNNDMTEGTADLFTVPEIARPAQAVNCPAASTSGTNLRRVEFSSSSAPTMFRVYHSQSGGGWVSLEGIYYYKS
ncbi:hypothetical protein [Brevibacterium aurantiacum]|uniref:hypothetical protein n=1 Tax=Brevibacterium aurantiacum TaxID=273384 RepID=UPI000F64A85E|nr:hypothetical protein [Brevibacterium aurantiacum]